MVLISFLFYHKNSFKTTYCPPPKSVITLKENPPACRRAGLPAQAGQTGKYSKIKQIFKNIASPKTWPS